MKKKTLDEHYQDLSRDFVVYEDKKGFLQAAKTVENKHIGKDIVITYDNKESAEQFAKTYKNWGKRFKEADAQKEASKKLREL